MLQLPSLNHLSVLLPAGYGGQEPALLKAMYFGLAKASQVWHGVNYHCPVFITGEEAVWLGSAVLQSLSKAARIYPIPDS